jgi:hypothetical protein
VAAEKSGCRFLGRIGRPEEIASDDASFVIGQVISPNGWTYL